MCRTVILVPPGTPGRNFSSGSSNDNKPRSTACKIMVAVNDLVQEPIRKWSSRITFRAPAAVETLPYAFV
ncbi:Uncharacterised protein [Mycobacteroides abscessus subsp. abscessus]|nr:Uncharacterised protein [Mycobacteroides abscessus subsp. abscessus]SIN29239.1 Uncharacterised protein [Mycobacteroides abscessus subsp. abscessus]